ncbi:hypothetical protein KY290_021027 [Solanum tuberosum]|uniref:Uncharacterized protein n=1 Tax=Solanum tuberosum TaxID=4113 RepID=A0ABQ7V0D9_SOLTU|nr:hypothetical protein KY290_021027 [Solanum tuberosum]
MQTPSETHWKAVKWVLRYLQGTVHFGLRLIRRNSLSLHMYSDADWAGDASDPAFTTGYLLFFGKNHVSWFSKRQRTIARSSTKAEYRVVASSFAQTNCVTNLLAELQLKIQNVPTIYHDNVGAMYLCDNLVFHSRMKHIAVDFHFVRKQVKLKQVQVVHINVADQLADTLTKDLSKPTFDRHMFKLGIVAHCLP